MKNVVVIVACLSIVFAATDRSPIHASDGNSRASAFEAFLIGCIRDRDGQPVTGAIVSVSAMGAWPRIPSDANGRFRYRVPRPGRYHLWASKESDLYPRSDSLVYASGACSIVVAEVVSPGETDVGDVVLAPKAGRLVCKLVDAATGEPFDSVNYELRRLDSVDAWETGGTVVNPRGTFTLLVPAAAVTLRLEEPGYEPCFVGTDGISDVETGLLLEAGETREVVVPFKRKDCDALQSGSL